MKKIFVGNLSFDSSEADVRRAFEDHGEVASVQILTDRETGQPRGFGFVEMGSDEQAEQAIAAMDGAMLNSRPLRVNEARPREDRGGGFRPAGGGYGREDRGGGFGFDDGNRPRRGGRGQRR